MDTTSDSKQQPFNPENDWQEWEHKIIGTPDEIKEALKVLNRRPTDAIELEKIILHNREQTSLKFAHEAEKGFKDYPW